jgi:hypothetical protein
MKAHLCFENMCQDTNFMLQWEGSFVSGVQILYKMLKIINYIKILSYLQIA